MNGRQGPAWRQDGHYQQRKGAEARALSRACRDEDFP
jgi:hypothetical protein